MVWGTFLEKNFPSSNGHFLDFGGVWTLAMMVWGTYAVKIEVQMVFAQVGPEIKCPRVPVWVKGGRCNRYLGNAQIDPAFFNLGLPLERSWLCTPSVMLMFTEIKPVFYQSNRIQRQVYLPAAAYLSIVKDKNCNNNIPNGGFMVGSILPVLLSASSRPSSPSTLNRTGWML